jgi:hypothetical protein
VLSTTTYAPRATSVARCTQQLSLEPARPRRAPAYQTVPGVLTCTVLQNHYSGHGCPHYSGHGCLFSFPTAHQCVPDTRSSLLLPRWSRGRVGYLSNGSGSTSPCRLPCSLPPRAPRVLEPPSASTSCPQGLRGDLPAGLPAVLSKWCCRRRPQAQEHLAASHPTTIPTPEARRSRRS